MKRKTWLLVITLAPALLTACILAVSKPRENCAESHDPRNTRTLRICTDKREYDLGEPIHITFTVTNVSDDLLILDGGDKPALDICLWEDCWPNGEELTPELTRVALKPGESYTLNWVWPTADTDLEALKNRPGELMFLQNPVFGSVIPWPGASSRSVWVDVVCHRP